MLDPHIKKRILEARARAEREGKLYSRTQLDKYFGSFRSRFGPDELKRLEGRELLARMHGRGENDSMAYWLEFKNDDEFPGTWLGGIGGGSAFKFGIFYRRATRTWLASGPTPKGHELTVEEAIALASKQRDQFLRGCELLQQLPVGADDAAYHQLENSLHELAPDVADSAWGHKYFYLIFPDKLDDFHSPVWQRFHLLKALQPLPEGEGRYVCAGRYVAMSRELDLPMHNFTCCLGDAVGPMHEYWRVRIGDDTGGPAGWNLMRAENWLAIGWPELGDLSGVDSTHAAKAELHERMAERYPGTTPQVNRNTEKVFRFLRRIRVGDLVLPWDGGQALGIGRVTGDYVYVPSSDVPHRRPVEWLSLKPWAMPEAVALKTTFHRTRKAGFILATERRLLDVKPPQPHSPQRLPGAAGRIQSILERKSQVILYGPPGTGKTYWADVAARELAATSAFGRPYQSLTEVERQEVSGTDQRPGLVRWCCFHPGYGYEDFIEGYRPETIDGRLSFRLVTGIFKQLCQDARQARTRRFYLIVDEINRGDVPRIFGELLTVLEKDKRDKPVVLPLSRETFSIPPNVYLIGTMNTADRSISLLDAALRRRFGFVELMPHSSVLVGHTVNGILLGPWLDALNRRICEHLGRDARNQQVGHAYLMQGGLPLRDMDHFRRALRDDIVPLLVEYCYDRPAALPEILGKNLWDEAASRVRYELFDPGREDGLVSALLEPWPDAAAESAGELDSEDVDDSEDGSAEQPAS